MKIELSKPYSSIHEQPIIRAVHEDIFTTRYFGDCMNCNFCSDSCCSYGADIDSKTEARLIGHTNLLAKKITLSPDRWLHTEETLDSEVAGGSYKRTRTNSSGCVFKSTTGRGCILHSYALESGFPYQEIKPIICSLFPLTWSGGALHLSEELSDKTLMCSGNTLDVRYPTAYTALRGELNYFFGESFVEELDSLECDIYAKRAIKLTSSAHKASLLRQRAA